MGELMHRNVQKQALFQTSGETAIWRGVRLLLRGKTLRVDFVDIDLLEALTVKVL